MIQVSLSKSNKHWNSSVTHCKGSITLAHTPPHPALLSLPLESFPLANQHRLCVTSKTSIQHQEPLIDMHNTMGQKSQVRSGHWYGDSMLAADEGEDYNAVTPLSQPGILLSHGHLSSSRKSQQNGLFHAL